MPLPIHYLKEAKKLELLCGERRLVMHRGDVTKLEADALVCPVDQNLDFRSGIARVISQGAGPSVRAERPKTPEAFGKLVVIPGGKLKAKYIFLSVLLGEKDPEKARLYIRQSVERALRYAEFLRIKSLAFPVLGSAKTKLPYNFIAHEMLECVIQYFRRRSTKIKIAVFSIFNDEAFSAFDKESKHIASL